MNDELLQEQLIHNLRKDLNSYSQAQWISNYDYINRYGREVNRTICNTQEGVRIAELDVQHFGSICDYEVDSLPHSDTSTKGTEITWVRDNHRISRRFMSKVLAEWSRIFDVHYKWRGIDLWCKKYDSEYLITGQEAIKMIGDIILMTRNSSLDKVLERCSNNLTKLILNKKSNLDKYIYGIKDRLYIKGHSYGEVWNFPIYNLNYLWGVIRELKMGHINLSVPIPIIKKIHKYPIRCFDIEAIKVKRR